MRFVTDGMLGKLTRWLRMLGHDVEYLRSLDDEQLMVTAKMERRVLLTRDFELYQRAKAQGVDSVFVKERTKTERLAQLAKQFHFNLEIDMKISRCPKCNSKINPLSREKVLGRVPETTLRYYREFWECPRCEQIYWRGAHWQRIEKTLKAAQFRIRGNMGM